MSVLVCLCVCCVCCVVSIDDCGTIVSCNSWPSSRHDDIEEIKGFAEKLEGLPRTRRLPPRTKRKTVMSALCATCQPLTGCTLRTAGQQFVHSKASNGYITAVFESFGVSQSGETRLMWVLTKPTIYNMAARPRTGFCMLIG